VTPVRYHEAAEEELLHEIGYLELRAEGLGRRFFAEVRKSHSWEAKNFSNTAQISGIYTVATSQTMCKSTLA